MMRALAAALLIALGSGAAVAQPLPAVLDQPALLTPRAAHALLLGVTKAGARLVAVGERGIVLLSDDDGGHWRQAAGVPTSVTLTAVRFASATSGWAIGHLGVILHSADGGERWQRQLDGVQAAGLMRAAAERLPAGEARTAAIGNAEQLVKDGADKPFLDLLVQGDRILVVGAYGLAVRSDDAGGHWTAASEIADPQGLHLYALSRAGATTLVAGEQGYLAVAQDGGAFLPVRTPYDGSLFGVTALHDGAALAFGLGGALIRSADAGAHWVLEPSGLSGAITCAVELPDLHVLLATDSGEIAVGAPGGRNFRPAALEERSAITAVLVDGDALILTGLAGPRRITLRSLGVGT